MRCSLEPSPPIPSRYSNPLQYHLERLPARVRGIDGPVIALPCLHQVGQNTTVHLPWIKVDGLLCKLRPSLCEHPPYENYEPGYGKGNKGDHMATRFSAVELRYKLGPPEPSRLYLWYTVVETGIKLSLFVNGSLGTPRPGLYLPCCSPGAGPRSPAPHAGRSYVIWGCRDTSTAGGRFSI